MTRPYHQTIKPIGARQPLVRALFTHIDRAGLSLRSVSERSGVDSTVLSNWRTGKTVPRLDLFIAVCQAVNMVLRMSAPSNHRSTTEQMELSL